VEFLSVAASLLASIIESSFKTDGEKQQAKQQVKDVLDNPSQAVLDANIRMKDDDVQIGQDHVMAANASGPSWLQRNWLPLFMMVFLWIIVYDYALYPILHSIFSGLGQIAAPEQMWPIIDVVTGVGVTGHYVHKITDTVFNNDKFYQVLHERMGKLSSQQVDALNSAIAAAEDNNQNKASDSGQ